MGNSTSKEEKAAVDFLRLKSADNIEGIPPYRQWSNAAKARTRVVLKGGVTTPAESTNTDDDGDNESVSEVTFQKEFRKFCERCPEWAADDVTLFWKQYEHISDLLVIRCQHSGLCFMHAPVTLQHYLVCISNGGKGDTGVIDVAGYINRYWKSERLADYLVRNRGGDSFKFFQEINHHVTDLILNLERHHLSNVKAEFWALLIEELQKRPVLVSYFRVRSSFHTSGSVSFTDMDQSEEEIGLHAMLMIGGRRSRSEYYFLLQNWWSGRYFIEVSSKYLQKTDPMLTIVGAHFDSIPKDFPITRAAYAETTVDCSETLDEML